MVFTLKQQDPQDILIVPENTRLPFSENRSILHDSRLKGQAIAGGYELKVPALYPRPLGVREGENIRLFYVPLHSVLSLAS